MPMMQTEAGKYIIYGFPVMSFAFMAFMPSAPLDGFFAIDKDIHFRKASELIR
jgi:hypothetical protein